MGWFGDSTEDDSKKKLAEAAELTRIGGVTNIKKAIQIYRMYEHGLGNIVQTLQSKINVKEENFKETGFRETDDEREAREAKEKRVRAVRELAEGTISEGGLGNYQTALNLYIENTRLLGKESTEKSIFELKLKIAKEHEELLDYNKAIQIYQEVGLHNEAKNARRKMLDEKKVDQTIVQGDQITKTEIKDSVLNRSNVGGGSSKMQELKDLTEMKEKGLIDDDEFKQMKKEILGK